MLTFKNCQISLYCHFNKIIKEAGISFQSPILSQKNVRNVCRTGYQYLTRFLFQCDQDSKEISISGNCTSSNAYNDVTDFEICGFHKSTKIRYLQNKILFFLQIKKVGISKTCTHLHHPAHFSLHLALCNNLNVIRTKITHVIAQFSQIQAEKFKVVDFD